MRMDELYIRMCQQAKEIRDTRKPKWVNLKPGFEDFEVVNDNDGTRWYIETTSMEGYVLYTWLPRQEDLQELIMKNGVMNDGITGFINTGVLIEEFKDFMDHNEGWFRVNGDLNCLWLMFTMSTVHQKVWTGTAWEAL